MLARLKPPGAMVQVTLSSCGRCWVLHPGPPRLPAGDKLLRKGRNYCWADSAMRQRSACCAATAEDAIKPGYFFTLYMPIERAAARR